jgi:CTP:molybdopterin cytidylyltransferase MocA
MAAVILAAGRSSRLGRFKPLVHFDGRTLIERAVSVFWQNRIADIIVVTGHRSDELRAVLKDEPVRIAQNEHYDRGMFSSVQVGVRHLPPGCEAFFVLPVDHALVQPVTIGRLIDAFRRHPGCICHPCTGGVRGHPPLVPTGLLQEIIENDGEGGLRKVLQHQDDLSLDVNVEDRNTLLDIDTPEDLARLKRSDRPT